jgi:hypothetical protein
MTITPTCPTTERLRLAGVENPEAFRKLAKEGFEYTRYDGHISHAVAAFLEPLNSIGGFSGVESLYPNAENLWYLNAGDTYTSTVFYDHYQDRFFISSLGDLAETRPSLFR